MPHDSLPGEAEFQRWYKSSPAYRRFWVPHGIDQQSILRALYRYRRYAGGVLLDIGCGTKKFQSVFAGGVTAYWGIDLYSGELHRLHTADVYGDAAALPLADASVTTVLAVQMLGYIEDPQTVLREIRRVLRPTGILILTYAQSGGAAGQADFYRFTESFYRAVLPKHGFEIEVLEARAGTMAVIGEELSTAVYYRGTPTRLRTLLCLFIQRCFGFIDRWIYLPYGGIGHIVVARKSSS